MKLFICLCLAAWPSALAIYFTGEKEIFQSPNLLRIDSYFGYSITYDQLNKKLVVSAPRENNIGVVYDCDIPSRTCSNLTVGIDRNALPTQYTHDYWFGATVKSGPNFVLMCAPRYTQHYYSKSSTDGFNKYVTFGRCFSHENGKMIEKRVINEEERDKNSGSQMETRMDSFGWSIDVASDDSILVGGPGMFRGRVMIYKPRETVPTFIKYKNNKDTLPEFDFGYAVASGMFLDKKLSYAIGSPYGTSGFGEVAFYHELKLIRKLVKVVDTDVIGSMFGAVLCAAKMSGKYHDLLVGAPTYATVDTYDLGAVYVYLTPKSKKSPTFKRRIVGESAGGQFGSAIANVGDLNGDHKDEIAISAPFENEGRGVVYLYSGHDLVGDKTEVTLKWMQKIEPEPSYAQSFGLSLTPLLDYDQNGCNELAIGSPYKDRVVLLRCMAAITVQTTAVFPNVKGRGASKVSNYDLQVCLRVTYPTLPTTIIARLSTTVMMTHSSAKLTTVNGPDGFTFEKSLNDKKGEYCEKIPFVLPPDGKYDAEISYAVKTKLLEDPMQLKKFESSRVILSDRSVLQVVQTAWAAECAGKICVPNFSMTPSMSFDNKNKAYIIGSTKTEHISLSMVNTGEVAYDLCLRVEILGTRVLKYPPACQANGTSLLCMPPTPIRSGDKWDTGSIYLDMQQLNNLDEKVTVNVSRYNYCKDVKPTENRPYTINMKPDPTGIIAKGENDIGAIVNVTREDATEKGKKITHVYTLSNSGPTNWVKLEVKVKLVKHEFIDDVSVHLSEAYNTMNCENDPKDESLYICVIESLKVQKDEVKILIPMSIKHNKDLEAILEEKNVTISSSISFEPIPGYLRNTSISTLVTLQDAKVPLMIIIIALVVGLLIVLIIAYVLYRVGFLQRKKKQELDKLKRSVKRQTILRRSTMPTQRSSQSSEQRRQVLEGIDDTDEDIIITKK
ncbi:unnamed protein product [Spodoptera littoralis]|uniref:Uncharacterized protein n=1 Tax=Spodoptera littoralis TaxID=7109 RepID=A0A9P0IDJ4_SPOLI|nr:unnamed protein product [Spodoptera littoralis]CAH1645882.1 unnamed protein product [Spodoptera littoralis]